jgi:hypothetical protein
MQARTLVSAEVGKVYNFDYEQPYSGETRRHLAKVVAVRKLCESDIARINHSSNYRAGDPQFFRTETIVTCQMSDGEYRNFYGERTARCRSSSFLNMLFWSGIARLIFRS